MLKLTRLIVALFFVALITLQGSQAQERRALLVQVSRYRDANDNLTTTLSTQDDITTIRGVLEDKYHFQIDTLEDSDATHDALIGKLKEIAAAAKPEDTIVLYFSGHGANLGTQFSLCPSDALKDSAKNDVTETDLQSWLDTLKTRNVTLILDCCFNSFGSRGPQLRSKFMDRPNNPTLPIKPDEQKVNISPDRAVILAASLKNGNALEFRKSGNKWIGLFTFMLQRQLVAASPETTFHSLMDQVTKDVKLWVSVNADDQIQVPGFKGSPALIDRKLFAPVPDQGRVAPPPVARSVRPYLLVTKVTDGKVYLNHGTDTGVVVGSEYAVYPEGETEFTDETRRTGRIKVETTTATEAIASSVEGTIGANNRATLTHIAPDPANRHDITLRLDGPGPFKEAMASALQQFPHLHVVTDPVVPAHIVLSGDSNNDGFTARLRASDGKTPIKDSFHPDSRTETLYQGKDAADVVAKLTPRLDQVVTLRQVALLDNPNPAWVKITSEKLQYTVGDRVKYIVTADCDCFLFVLDVDSAGTPYLLFPRLNGDNRLTAGKPLSLPLTGGYPVGPPTGKDTTIVLAVADSDMAGRLKNNLFAMAQASPDDGSRSVQFEEGLQDLQVGPLDTWSINTVVLLTLASEKGQGQQPSSSPGAH